LDEAVVGGIERVCSAGDSGDNHHHRAEVQAGGACDSGDVCYSQLVVEQEVGSRTARSPRRRMSSAIAGRE